MASSSSSSAAYNSLDSALVASRVRRIVVSRGQNPVVGSLTFEVLNPVAAPANAPGSGPVVLRLTCPETSVLSVGQNRTSFFFASDVDTTTESDIILSDLPLRAGVLKVASHGNCSATSPAFLEGPSTRTWPSSA